MVQRCLESYARVLFMILYYLTSIHGFVVQTHVHAFRISQTEEGNIHLDHVLNLTLPTLHPAIERTLRSIETSCREVSHSFMVVGYAAAAYLVMAGVARIMDARTGRLPPPPPNHKAGDV